VSTMTETRSRTREYYNSTDADTFYFEVWGGEDIHIGVYEGENDTIREASRRTVETMARVLHHREVSTRILDLGSGYGGSARYLAQTLGATVTCVNLSEIQNERNRTLNSDAGLAEKITVLDGSFEDIPCPDASFDVVWTQDAILHSGDREKVFHEVDRVLAPGGEWVFTDPMQRGGVPPRDLAPVLSRLQLDSLGSIDDYKIYADKLGWELLGVNEMPDQLRRHYQQVHDDLEARSADFDGRVSADYIVRMLAGLRHWVEASRAQRLNWGILHFKKPA